MEGGGAIRAIPRGSVHKICSGQVVLTLATAVKELVENSIDAGATIIEVKLKDHGSELVEVIDNGKGVKPCDFQSLTLKHHTSKINDFSDVPFVSTFGFRGEALSSLCALSDLEVLTCHADSPVGTHLSFDHDGTLVSTTPTPRQVGTTVTLKNLFHTLPVRRKEFLKNVKREFGKMVHLLTAYCVISLDRRITCTHITDKGKKSVVLSTNSSENLRNNMLSVFGSKQVNQLMEITQLEPSVAVLEEYFLPASVVEKSKMFRIEGFISNSTHGEGRSAADRQFFFIDGRPCDLPKVSKLINEIYHTFNRSQYPFVLLNVVLTEGSADVNVTPDKRQVFIPEEKLLLAVIKSTLLGMYGSQPSQMKLCSSSAVLENQKLNFSGSLSSSPTSRPSFESRPEVSLKRPGDSDGDRPSPPAKSQRVDDDDVEMCDDFRAATPHENTSMTDSPSRSAEPESTKARSPESIGFTLTLPFREEGISPKRGVGSLARFAHRGSPKKSNPKRSIEKWGPVVIESDPESKTSGLFSKFALNRKRFGNDGDLASGARVKEVAREAGMATMEAEIVETNSRMDVETDGTEGACIDHPTSRKKSYRTISFDLASLKEELEKISRRRSESEECRFRKFRSKISPTDNVVAEEELKKEISKEDFSRMKIIGQFNLGFIVTKLDEDLFIVDQHATDEKYNYETLQKDTILETQKLLNPQTLSLTAVSESILTEHLHVFEKNGFRFRIEEDAKVGDRVQLVSVPVSHNWSFGKEDVDELIFMLTDNPIKMVRPSRVNQMFASRACRKSVMIGTALTHAMMKKLVLHMGEIEQPWNCPHGRPTMRHLFNLNFVK
ncbi:mismatch repair endonuclease PMS2-like [Uloborus diversus]|uniref:mismatch repair endonuclease PMS2-like n=1 Tax=Uloborus diversus TaxID=327109 RepID=UPI002409F0EA|nr:mismatch repair endonuclease PMS2-like [Uloborus diversus]